MRDAAGEIRGAVDRVDDPGALAGSAQRAALLLTEEGVLGERLVQAEPDQRLDLGVACEHVVLRALEGDGERRGAVAEAAAGERAGLERDRRGGEEAVLEIRAGCAQRPSPPDAPEQSVRRL